MFYRRESFKQFLQRYPIISLIIASNVIVFLYLGVVNGIWGSPEVVLKGGILPSEYIEGEYWRFITYAFLHDGLTHLVMNMFFLIIIAPPLEIMIGKVHMLFLFIFTILSTSFSVFFIGSQAGVGASGFTYGILGLYIYIVLFHKGFLDVNSKKIVLIWTAVGWVSSLLIPNISLLGHLGGFVGGFVYGWIAIRHNTLRHWLTT
ncbi:MAG: rhomboid family intramembrane serine protease [Paenibacillaceae bacterium]